MHRFELEPERGFSVLASTGRSQAATMVLAAGAATGGPDNRHDGADQWLLVLSGHGSATVAGEEVGLAPGVLVVIEAGETHEIRAGDGDLATLNVYAPPAY